MKIIIYGLGKWTDKIENMLKKEHEIIGYSDSYSLIKSYKCKAFYKPSDLKKIKFDILIIAIDNLKICQLIYQELYDELKMIKIIFFIEWYKRFYAQKIDRVLENKKFVPKSIILGISHAVCGINPYLLDGINLAVRSQDIYYNMKTLDYYLNYIEVSNIENVILEMYDYNYFNYDVSQIRNCFLYYYTVGGYVLDKHNFKNNYFYKDDFEIEKEKWHINRLNIEELLLWKELFKNDFSEYRGYDSIYNSRIDINPELPSRKFVSDIVTNRFETTILENISVFNEICQLISRRMSKSKLWIVLVPRYYSMELALKPHLRRWKKEFYEIIEGGVKRINLLFWI